jgi:hypothetical protein
MYVILHMIELYFFWIILQYSHIWNDASTVIDLKEFFVTVLFNDENLIFLLIHNL